MNYMMACALYGIQDLRVEQTSIPSLEKGQVLVKIRAAGICGSDVERVFTKGVYHYPTIIGHEFSGDVVSASCGEEKWIGKRVSVFPLIPCNTCESCLEGRYAQCKHYDYYGSRRDGGFAEYLAVNTWNLLAVPDTVNYECAAMFEPAAVALHALRQAGDMLGKTLVILGVGTVALILAQIAKIAGCSKVILVVRSKAKAEYVKSLGFNEVINSNEEDVKEKIEKITNNRGIDVVVEGCGKSSTFSLALQIVCSGGTIICMGNPVEDMTQGRDTYWNILRKQITIKGTWNSSFKVTNNDWSVILDLVKDKKLNLEDLITDKYKLDQAEEAFNSIYHNPDKKVHIKSMFIVGGEK